jgi:hypothetical protein
MFPGIIVVFLISVATGESAGNIYASLIGAAISFFIAFRFGWPLHSKFLSSIHDWLLRMPLIRYPIGYLSDIWEDGMRKSTDTLHPYG